MVRVTNAGVMQNGVQCVDLAGLSTDVKPIGFATGSSFLEVDTTDVYLYDEESQEWNKVGGE